ncbi:chitobiase/beta-hexosaminidase C-terminal domain-containing protein [Micromonospora chersina]|uniref:chitobiase/beta-hexosaminidase C-terminal domain-containing protein n=1 Tax=Micromonospora chersina TaxID=47854 RepID=UPI003404EFF4
MAARWSTTCDGVLCPTFCAPCGRSIQPTDGRCSSGSTRASPPTPSGCTPSTTRLVPGGGTYSGPVDVRSETSEPATIYYTTDGSRPTLEPPRYPATEFREPGQVFHVTETTTFRWFSVDSAGNIEQNYDPSDNDRRNNYRRATFTVAEQ